MNTFDSSYRVSAVHECVGEAVGMEKNQWFVALVKHNTEKNSAEKMNKMGIITYLPIQSEYKVWKNGRKAKVDRVVIPSTIFVNCTEKERREIVRLPFINRFMTNNAGENRESANKPLAIIPENEIDRLKFMLGQSDILVELTSKPLKTGDRVKVVRGSLLGLEGEVIDLKDSKSEIIVNLNFFGYARLTIDRTNLEIIK